MACKIAVLRKDTSRKFIGDCIEAFESHIYLGDSVEPVGGVYVIIEVIDASKNNETITKLTKQWEIENPNFDPSNPEINDQYVSHSNFDRQFYLRPAIEGDEFFTALSTTGRISVTVEKIEQYIRERNA